MEEPLQPTVEPSSPSRPKNVPATEKTLSKNASNSAKKDKKSAAAAGSVANADGSNAGEVVKDKSKEGKEKKSKDDMTIDDLLLPRTLISRLSRGSLPPNTSLQKDALLALTKSATVFISYLAHTANSLTSRKTIQAEDILKAISEMELDSIMRERLEKEILLFEEGVRGKRKGYRDRVKARESGVSQIDGTEADDNGTGDHVHKRIKRATGDEDVDMSGVSDPARHNASNPAGGINNADEEDDEQGDDDDDDPSAQLLAEASRAAGHDDPDETEPDQDEDDDHDDDAVDNEDEDEDEVEEEDQNDGHEADDGKNRQRYLAPDGRAEIDGSDNESD